MYRRFCLCKDCIRCSFCMSQKSITSFERIAIAETKNHFRRVGKWLSQSTDRELLRLSSLSSLDRNSRVT